jgi:tetratricopeptide (TPR) repeat protein
MLDVQLYGLHPGRHHLTNLLFHIVNTILLFGILRRMTGKLWQSGFVAALFALHPLHVESVVWVAERKDLLSTLFGLLVLWSYTRYVQNPGVGRYVAVLLFFLLGLMTKPMMVTLPFVLLLLDYWPLRRLHFESAIKVEQPAKQSSTRWFLIVEKLPLFIVSAASCIVTIYAQKSGDSIVPLDAYPLLFRISNAFISYVSYVGKMIWPSNLAIIYPYNIILPTLNILAAILFVLGISLLAVRYFKSRPWFIVGWFWYLGTLVPVIGLVQVGTQSMADRYTYIPLIGLFIILAWALFEFLARWSYQKLRFAVITLGVSGVLMAIAWQQVGYWKNSVTIFKRAVDVTDKNFVAHNNLGHGLLMQGKTTEAFEHFKKSSEINPKFAIAHLNLGLALSEQKKYAEAIQSFTRAVEEKPNFAIAYNLLGKTQSQIGKSDQAIQNYLKAININPKYAEAYNSAGVALIRMDQPRRAIAFFREALRLDPDYYAAQRNLDKTLAALKMLNDKSVVN